MEKTKLSVSCALKHFNKEFKKNYKLSDVAWEASLPESQLRNLTTETSLRKLYIICEAFYRLFPEMNEGYFDFSYILIRLSDDCDFWV